VKRNGGREKERDKYFPVFFFFSFLGVKQILFNKLFSLYLSLFLLLL